MTRDIKGVNTHGLAALIEQCIAQRRDDPPQIGDQQRSLLVRRGALGTADAREVRLTIPWSVGDSNPASRCATLIAASFRLL